MKCEFFQHTLSNLYLFRLYGMPRTHYILPGGVSDMYIIHYRRWEWMQGSQSESSSFDYSDQSSLFSVLKTSSRLTGRRTRQVRKELLVRRRTGEVNGVSTTQMIMISSKVTSRALSKVRDSLSQMTLSFLHFQNLRDAARLTSSPVRQIWQIARHQSPTRSLLHNTLAPRAKSFSESSSSIHYDEYWPFQTGEETGDAILQYGYTTMEWLQVWYRLVLCRCVKRKRMGRAIHFSICSGGEGGK